MQRSKACLTAGSTSWKLDLVISTDTMLLWLPVLLLWLPVLLLLLDDCTALVLQTRRMCLFVADIDLAMIACCSGMRGRRMNTMCDLESIRCVDQSGHGQVM